MVSSTPGPASPEETRTRFTPGEAPPHFPQCPERERSRLGPLALGLAPLFAALGKEALYIELHPVSALDRVWPTEVTRLITV